MRCLFGSSTQGEEDSSATSATHVPDVTLCNTRGANSVHKHAHKAHISHIITRIFCSMFEFRVARRWTRDGKIRPHSYVVKIAAFAPALLDHELSSSCLFLLSP